jgi:hypothetical protein
VTPRRPYDLLPRVFLHALLHALFTCAFYMIRYGALFRPF